MGKRLLAKFKEGSLSVLPISILVLILAATPLINLTSQEIITFILCSILLIIGIALFNLGADLGIEPMGEQVGSTLIKTKRMKLILFVCFVLGVLITVAEPDLSVLANQLKDAIPSLGFIPGNMVLIIAIGLGVGIFIVIGVLKIITKKDLSMILLYFYMMLYALATILIFSGNGKFISISFDSGGVTTGPVTVPFIMALGVGFSSAIGGRDARENSFGLISLSSIGPIIAVVLLGLTIKASDIDVLAFNYNHNVADSYVLNITASEVAYLIGINLRNIFIALALVFLFFLVIDLIFIKLPKKNIKIMIFGLLYALVGLTMFLTSAELGFLPIGFKIGTELAKNPVALIITGFIIGMFTVLAEPAVHVLTNQVDEITLGAISKKTLLIALSIGVGISLSLSMIRIRYNFSLLYYVIPGYLISFGLSFFVPHIYTSIAFDSGGVASGPLTTSFILPIAIGACTLLCPDNIFENGYGIVAMVAMTPLITIQLLGFRSVALKKIEKTRRLKNIERSKDDDILINF
ncbi:MAG: DUF1538 domain-containing protein [Acholeplasmatales bacterium]|nr:DUF1538 domain-containing protein [Acholeplasmatales bacterium]